MTMIIVNFFTVVLFLLPLASPQCSLLSVSDCHFNPDEVSLTLTSDYTQYLDISTQYLEYLLDI